MKRYHLLVFILLYSCSTVVDVVKRQKYSNPYEKGERAVIRTQIKKTSSSSLSELYFESIEKQKRIKETESSGVAVCNSLINYRIHNLGILTFEDLKRSSRNKTFIETYLFIGENPKRDLWSPDPFIYRSDFLFLKSGNEIYPILPEETIEAEVEVKSINDGISNRSRGGYDEVSIDLTSQSYCDNISDELVFLKFTDKTKTLLSNRLNELKRDSEIKKLEHQKQEEQENQDYSKLLKVKLKAINSKVDTFRKTNPQVWKKCKMTQDRFAPQLISISNEVQKLLKSEDRYSKKTKERLNTLNSKIFGINSVLDDDCPRDVIYFDEKELRDRFPTLEALKGIEL